MDYTPNSLNSSVDGGNADRLEMLIRAFYAEKDHLRGYVYAATQDYHVMEDLLQEMAITVARKAETFEVGREPLPWFMGIARVHIMRWYEKKGREHKIFRFELLENSELFATYFSSSEVAPRERALIQCLEKLPQKQRKIIDLRYADRMNCSGIAERIGITVKGVYAVLDRVKVRLKKCVNQRVEEGATA